MAMRIPFDWNTIAMANSLLLESSPYLSGASYANNDENENRKMELAHELRCSAESTPTVAIQSMGFEKFRLFYA